MKRGPVPTIPNPWRMLLNPPPLVRGACTRASYTMVELGLSEHTNRAAVNALQNRFCFLVSYLILITSLDGPTP